MWENLRKFLPTCITESIKTFWLNLKRLSQWLNAWKAFVLKVNKDKTI